MKLFHTFIQQAAYDVLVENRKTALRRSGGIILHGEGGWMPAQELAEAQRVRAEMSLKSVAEHSWGTKMTQCVA